MTDAFTPAAPDANGFPEDRPGLRHPDAGERSGDALLRHALDHAPDHSALPDDELRQAVRTFAHEAVAPSLPERRTGFLRRAAPGVGGLEARANARRGRRLLRNLAVAAILIAILATVTWHREPAPARRPEVAVPPAAPVTQVAPSVSDGASVVPALPAASASMPGPVASGAAQPSPAQGSDALSALDRLVLSKPPPSVPTPPNPTAPAMPPVAMAPVPAPASRPVPAVPATSTSPAAPAKSGAPAMPAMPGMPVVPIMPPTPAVVERPAPPRTSTPPVLAAPTTRTADMPPPSFVALSQWTHLTLSRADGQSRRRPKAEVRELGALLGSAALSAAGPDPLASRVDWRIALDRNGQPLARLELAGGQVRWTENGTLPAAGTPPPGALAGLRQTLEASLNEPTAAAGEGAVSTAVDPQPAAPER
jgi:hypothetical protein